jgi:UDP-N-acetylmuramoylalanine--D-glutamate ligase
VDLRNKQVAVLGLGESGEAAAELLLARGARVVIMDSQMSERVRQAAERFRVRGVTVEIGETSRASCRFDLAVLSPGIDPARPLVRQLKDAGTPVVGELELAWRFCQCPVVAITGTNGKSTTTELVAAALTAGGKKTLAGGNIGKAFSRLVADHADLDVVTLEVSSFQLETVETFRPRIAVYLNLTPDHLDRYPTMTEYRLAKERIFMNQGADDYAVVNAGLELPPLRARRTTFSALGLPADYTFEEGWLVCRGERVLLQSETFLRGPHNAENQLATLAVADIYGLEREPVLEALRTYRPLPHRCEWVAEIDGVHFVNDSKATNIDALEKALLAQRSPVVLIAGGKDKGISFDSLAPLVREKVRAAVLIGEMAGRMAASWTGVECHRAEDLPAAVARARALARAGDTVLLSPGCSSYDMFKNFEERGDIYKQLVKEQSHE